MAIDGLSSTSALLAALRAEVSKKSDRAGKTEPHASGEMSRADQSQGRPAPDTAVLRKELTALVKDIDVRDESAVDAARPRVVRAVLLWEFGQELREHPEWQPMLDQIVAALAADPQQRSQFDAMVRELREQH